MRVHLLDGTYELFRHHFGRPPHRSAEGSEAGATLGVVGTVLSMLEGGVTHLGVATDHVIESFRNDLWPGYKTGAGVEPALLAQFPTVEWALDGLGVRLWPMVELEADDALASAAHVAAACGDVEQVRICTPDKDLAQCVVGGRVVQLDRRADKVVDEAGVVAKFGVPPASIPDFLALVGDSADGFPGLPGWGRKSAAALLSVYGHLEDVPTAVADWDPGLRARLRGAPKLAATLAEGRDLAALFKRLATLVVDPSLLGSVDDLRWRGPAPAFDEVARFLADDALAGRVDALCARRRR